jgi:hypothetical protein
MAACREGFDDIVQILLTPIQYNETSDVRYPLQVQHIPQDTKLMNYNGMYIQTENLYKLELC